MKLLNTIALIEDIRKPNLCRGQVGSLVEELAPEVAGLGQSVKKLVEGKVNGLL